MNAVVSDAAIGPEHWHAACRSASQSAVRGALVPRFVKLWVATALVASGGLLYAASWQRWAGACPWRGDQETQACETRMDHLYDFLPPTEPWAPAGVAAQLAGASMLVLAAALLALTWAVPGRRPGRLAVAVAVAAALAVVDLGLATLRSGIEGTLVSPAAGNATIWLWVLVPPLLLARVAVLSGGWANGLAAGLLVLGSPLVAAFSYAIGPFDAAPWWEAISGLLTSAAGACLLVGALRRPGRRPDDVVEPAVAA